MRTTQVGFVRPLRAVLKGLTELVDGARPGGRLGRKRGTAHKVRHRGEGKWGDLQGLRPYGVTLFKGRIRPNTVG